MTPRDGAFDQALAQLIEGRLSDPFAFLGLHETPTGTVIRTFQPGALTVEVLSRETGAVIGTLSDTADGLFVGGVDPATPYTLRIQWPGAVQETEDPYSFGVVLGDTDLYLHAEGKHWELADRMGAQPREMDGIAGVAFSVWAPNARRVSVIGGFNAWDGRRHPMRLRHDAGIWELFIPRVGEGTLYKYEVLGADGQVRLKADPLARATERPPATGSVVAPLPRFEWSDGEWMAERIRGHAADAPIAVYEVHAASWLRPAGDPTGTLDWKDLADKLIPYATQMGFTHIELLPIMEHPFAGSWGYQPVSQFAPSARFGPAEDFAFFVNECHRAGLGVILDWVPAHFPNDEHGLVHFDGTSLYEHQDPREGFHKDWNTLIYNFGRAEVRGFLIASGLWWLETFHIDGLRVDAVASMLYRDYSRQPGEWIPNIYGGRENLEAVEFLKQFNTIVAERCPGAMTIAEESTAWPGVSARVTEGGLGFTYKWNMGWMHDTLSYMEHQPVHRPWHHNEMTFGLIYAFSERFVLPLSHDEVVHGKGSLIGKMPGDQWQRFANLRAYFGFMWTHPGKKLLFMGGEIAQEREWSHDGEIDWGLLQQPEHAAIQRLITDLNNIYAAEGALHTRDADPQGFSWVVGDDTANSVFAYLRHGRQGAPLLVAINMTPVPRHGYRIGVPVGGGWRELLNTDAVSYGGGGIGNDGAIYAGSTPSHGHAQSLELSLPPLATVILKPEGASDVVA